MNFFKKVSAILLSLVMASTTIQLNMKQVQAEVILTSPLISVSGYQMKLNTTSKEGITFRTVCKSPAKGETITVGDKEYTVTNIGTIYVKDPNRSGNNANNVLSKAYTLLDSVSYNESGKTFDFKYIGIRAYNGTILTFGYLATDKGILSTTEGYSSYIRTMTDMDNNVLNTLHIRAFVEARDDMGNDVLIYGEEESLVSVAQIAYKVYNEGLATNREGHEYLYNNILSKLPSSSPFYLGEPIEYGWSDIVKP